MTFLQCVIHNTQACHAIGMVNTTTANDYAVIATALIVGIACILTLIAKL